MDWALAIDRNRKALLGILAMLFAATGLGSGRAATRLPRAAYRRVLRLLRPAESATRRLIVIVARKLSPLPRPIRAAPVAPIPPGSGTRAPCFPLSDPRKRFGIRPACAPGPDPRLSVIGLNDPDFSAQEHAATGDSVSAARLNRRLAALKAALDDLPRQARRLARRQARYRPALRIGQPPGHRARHRHPVDAVLAECHALVQSIGARNTTMFDARSSPGGGA